MLNRWLIGKGDFAINEYLAVYVYFRWTWNFRGVVCVLVCIFRSLLDCRFGSYWFLCSSACNGEFFLIIIVGEITFCPSVIQYMHIIEAVEWIAGNISKT